MVNPRGRGAKTPPPPITVKVTLPNGRVSSGRLVAITDFYVTVLDDAGVRRTFPRDNEVPKVDVNDPLQAHLDMLLKYTDADMHNLTAYLVGLK
jgi:cytochrome c oxidase cbb3-type subunit 3